MLCLFKGAFSFCYVSPPTITVSPVEGQMGFVEEDVGEVVW